MGEGDVYPDRRHRWCGKVHRKGRDRVVNILYGWGQIVYLGLQLNGASVGGYSVGGGMSGGGGEHILSPSAVSDSKRNPLWTLVPGHNKTRRERLKKEPGVLSTVIPAD